MAEDERAPRIRAEHLFKIFGDHRDEALGLAERGLSQDEIVSRTGALVAVHDATFEIFEGEIFVIMGLSGSGKSTLVRMLNRLIEPSAGHVWFGDRDITALSRRELIRFRRRETAMVFQSFALLPHLTALDNAAFALDVAGVPAAERRKRAREALATVGLERDADKFPRELSGGMQQRVGLARALALNPSVMLMDEAFSALDPLIRTDMQEELLHIQRERGLTVVFVSHDLDEAVALADRIAIMAGGVICQIGAADEILAHPADEYVRSFFREVDVGQVLSAGDICRSEPAVITWRGRDGIEVAMMVLRHRKRRYGYVRDRQGRFRGVVSVESLERARNAAAAFDDAYLEGVDAVTRDTLIADLKGRVAEAPCPLPVVDDDGRFCGSISQATLLRGLSREEEDEQA